MAQKVMKCGFGMDKNPVVSDSHCRMKIQQALALLAGAFKYFFSQKPRAVSGMTLHPVEYNMED